MTRNLLVLPMLLIAGTAFADCAEQAAAREDLQQELAEVQENIAHGYRIRSHAEAGFHTSAQRVPVLRDDGKGGRRFTGEWMTRHMYLAPDDPGQPLDPVRLRAPIDPAAEALRRDALIDRLAALSAGCGG